MPTDGNSGGWWWPDVSTPKRARAAAMRGAVAACITAVVTLVLATVAMYQPALSGFSPWAILDAAVFAAVAFGIWCLSRTAAIAGLALYVLDAGHRLVTAQSTPPILTIFFILFLIHAVRGTFSYHHLAETADQPGRQTDTSASGGPAA